MDIDKEYDESLLKNLKRRLNRHPSLDELINADNDSNIVDESFWDVLCLLNKRLNALEGNDSVKKINVAEDITIVENSLVGPNS